MVISEVYEQRILSGRLFKPGVLKIVANNMIENCSQSKKSGCTQMAENHGNSGCCGFGVTGDEGKSFQKTWLG